VLLAAKDLPGALASFQKATAQAPKAQGYALNLARAHLLNRDMGAALDVLNGVLKAEPGLAPALVLAAASTLQAGQLEKAAGYIERLRQAAPTEQITHVLEGDLAMAQKRYSQALEHYRAASVSGTNAALVLAQYNAGVQAGVARPEKVLEDWLAKNPQDVGVTTALAEHRHRNGDVAGAIKLYEGVLAASPDTPLVLNNLAVLYQAKGDPRALEMARKANALAPAAPAIQDTYGWLLVEGGRVDEGLALLRDAVRQLPGNAEVQYHYGAALAKKGNTAEAIAVLKKALAGQLPPAAKTDAQQLLQQLSQ
jgi:predicted Zn-dependent protease